jgi:hypothetical protein
VVTEMKDVLCYSIDAESKAGRVIAKNHVAQGLPAMVFLEPDGSVRDKIVGFLPAEDFIAEVQRIKKNEFTLGGLRKQVAANPMDLAIRWHFAQKLEQLGDKKAHDREIEFIHKNDPDGTSIGSRSLRFAALKKTAVDDMDFQGVYDFLEKETDADLLLNGWFLLFQVESYLADEGEEGARQSHRKLQISAARALWSHVPEKRTLRVANAISAALLNASDKLEAGDVAFLIEVSEAAARRAPKDANSLAMYGASLFLAERTQEAIAQLKRCVEIAPKNARWRDQLARYEKKK